MFAWEDMQAYMECTVLGNPTPSVTWLKGDKVLNAGAVYDVTSSSSSPSYDTFSSLLNVGCSFIEVLFRKIIISSNSDSENNVWPNTNSLHFVISKYFNK